MFHVIDREFLREASRQTRKSSAPGVDQVTAAQYADNLDDNLRDLHERLRDNRYVAPPVERVWIEKEDGKQRPIGTPCFEDKMVQRAVVMILEAIFEQDFHAFSHGFRKGHSQHQALHELREQCRKLHINWIVDADVSGFFDNLDWGHLREFITQRVNDGGILRLIGKWLHAGVLEAGALTYPDKGTPQGGVVSPMVSNVFLHHVLDAWFVKDVQPRMKGRCFVTRFADDCIIGCELEADARRVMAVLPKRLQSLPSDHASRKDGVDCVQEATKSRPIGRGQGDLRLARIDPLLGQDTPWILGHQAQDGRETTAPVYASDLDMVSGEPPCAIARAVSDLRCETARLLPILWYTWQLQDARSGLRADRAGLALLAEQTQPQGPHKLAEVCRFRPSQLPLPKPRIIHNI